MKKIVEAIKIGESVGKKVLGRATEEDNRAIAGWEGAEEKKDELFQKISNPDFIQEKALFYKNFDVHGTPCRKTEICLECGSGYRGYILECYYVLDVTRREGG